MISTDMTITGAAGVAPMPAVVVGPFRCDEGVLMAPIAAPLQGTGLPTGASSVARPWELPGAGGRLTGTGAPFGGTAVQHTTDFVGDAARTAGYAERTTRSSTPGAQPPRDPLS